MASNLSSVIVGFSRLIGDLSDVFDQAIDRKSMEPPGGAVTTSQGCNKRCRLSKARKRTRSPSENFFAPVPSSVWTILLVLEIAADVHELLLTYSTRWG